MSGHDTALPGGFEALEPFVAYWAKDSSQARMNARCEAPMEDIQAFYDAMADRAEDAIAYLEGVGLGKFDPKAERLALLVLALAQAVMAVEVHKAPRAPGTPYPNSIRLTQGPAFYG